METQRHFARLYLEGLSSGDFEPAMRELMGEKATLSASTILRLRADWQAEYGAFRSRPITKRFAYVWCDGIYLGAGLEKENSCLLVVIGAGEDGRKELLAMDLGYRESTESWAGVLRGLRGRGLEAPLLAVGDGALGLWAGLREVFPATAHQRCWNHKAMNVLDRLPKRLQAEARQRITAIWSSPTRAGGRAGAGRHGHLAPWSRPGRCSRHPAAGLGRPGRLLRPARRALVPHQDQQRGGVGVRRRPAPDRRRQAGEGARERAPPGLQDSSSDSPATGASSTAAPRS